VKVGGHHGQGSHLRSAGHSEGLAEDRGHSGEPAFDGGGEQDDRGSTRERELEADVPREFRSPREHAGRGEGERGPNVGRPAEARCGDCEPTHHRGTDCGRGGSAGKGVQADESERGPGCVTADKRLERALHDARENCDFQAAEDEEVYEASGDQRVLEAGRDPLPSRPTRRQAAQRREERVVLDRTRRRSEPAASQADRQSPPPR